MCAVVAAKIRDAEFRDQAVRASKSVFLAIADGLLSPRIKVRKVYFERVRGSLTETVAACDGASALSVIDSASFGGIMVLANRVEAMLIAMTR
jgi:four helix bundle protein